MSFGSDRQTDRQVERQLHRWTDGQTDLRLDGLGHGADLVDLEQQTVAGLLVHCLLDPLGIGHCEVVSYDLIGQKIHTGELL